MQRKAIGATIAFVLLGALAVGVAQQVPGDYLDIYTVQVKPEKRADFDAITKKMIAANRENKGDIWLAMETVYGPGNRVTFISTRANYEAVEAAMGAFNHALEKTYGKGTDKLMQDFNQCVERSRGEIRRRRMDLSSNPPTDPEAYAKLIAGSRWLRTTAVHVKPGESAKFEELLKDLKEAREKASPPVTVLVSQAVAGQEGTVYYLTSLQSSLAGFDGMPSMQKMLGDEGYGKFLKTSAETVSGTDTVINRYLPELSNAPEAIVALAPDYWRPKAATPMNAKAGTKSPVVNAAEKTKMNDKNK